MGKVTAVIDALWGDGGKGGICDYISNVEDIDIAVRFNGGSNAGHSVEMDDGTRHKVHLLPAAAFTPGVLCVMGAGTVIDPTKLVEEIHLANRANHNLKIAIDSHAHVVTPYHVEKDKQNEETLGKKKIGTTLTGNGPAYADKAARTGIRMKDLTLKGSDLIQKISRSMSFPNVSFPEDNEEITNELCSCGEMLSPMYTDVAELVNKSIDQGGSVLFCGAHGTMLDIDYGYYPDVTSSTCTVSGVGVGAGVSPRRITDAIGVVKAYTTRVGAGPMPTEIEGNLADQIRDKGKEFGTTTGRPRRIGWLDLPVVKYATMLNGFDYIALTLLDVLSGLKDLSLCTSYRNNGTPVLNKLPGWDEDISQCGKFRDLPPAARNYVGRIETELGIPVKMISVGPRRSQMIDMR